MNIPNIKTNPGLLKKLTAVAGEWIPPDEVRMQQASFIFGQMGGRASRKQIETQLDKQGGK